MSYGLETGGRLLGGLLGGLGGAGRQAAQYGAGGAVAGAAGGAVVGAAGIVTGPGELVIEPAAIGTGALVGGGLGAVYGGAKGFIEGVPAGADQGAEYGRKLSDWITQMTTADEKAEDHPAEPTDGCAGQCGKADQDATPSDGAAEPWTVPPGVRSKIPPEWGEGSPNKKGVGKRWTDPEDQGNGVRIDRGDPTHRQPTQQEDHVIVRSGGKIIGRDGNPIDGSIQGNAEQAHIPAREYSGWRSWNHP